MRLWQVKLEVYHPLASMPYPDIIVEEMQVGPEYRVGARPTLRGGQLVMTVSGEGRFKRGDNEYVLSPGCGFLHNHFDATTSYWYPASSRQPWVFLWIAFGGDTAEKMVADMVDNYGSYYDLSPDGGEVIRILRSWHKWRNSVKVLSPPRGAELITSVFTALAASKDQGMDVAPGSRLVQQAQELIMRDLEAVIGVNEIAEALQVSREHLSRLFHDTTGTRLRDYIRIAKIDYSRWLLHSTNQSCQEIAARLGYESQAAFARAFKQVMHVSPSTYRNSVT